MASQLDIYNNALITMGEKELSSLAEDVYQADVLDAIWDMCRQALLRRHVWNFAKRRAELTINVGTPVSEFDYSHALPDSFLRAVAVSNSESMRIGIPYKIEDDDVLSNSDTLYMTYVIDVTDTTAFDALFADALAKRLAVDTALRITGSATKKEICKDEYRQALLAARSVDALEDYPDQLYQGSWIDERHQDYALWVN